MKKIWFVFGVFLISVATPVSATLPEKFKKNFSEIVKDYCHSRTVYSITDPVGEWTEEDGWTGQAQEFHKTIGCIFDSALQEELKYEKERVEKAFDGDLPIKLFQPEGECQPKFLQIVEGEQEANNFVSECAKSEIPDISQVHSACRVAETVLQEWCGYDLFLYAKSQDEVSFSKQGGDLGILTTNRGDRNFGLVQAKIAEERARAEQAVFETIAWYQEAEHASRQSAWLIAIREELRKIQVDWGLFRSALGTFLDKFVNASIAP